MDVVGVGAALVVLMMGLFALLIGSEPMSHRPLDVGEVFRSGVFVVIGVILALFAAVTFMQAVNQ
jgi:hypothetical protein